MDLTPNQSEAVRAKHGVFRVIAAAGSGKTAVLTQRIDALNRMGVRPDRILAITFTKKAAKEMQERLKRLMGNAAEELNVSTIHSLGYRILRDHWLQTGESYQVLADYKQKQKIKSILAEPSDNNPYGMNWEVDISLVMGIISAFKNNLWTPAMAVANFEGDPKFPEAYKRYDQICQREGFIDLDDMLLRTFYALRDNPSLLGRWQNQFEYVLVDEAQDTNWAQWQIIQALALPQNNLFIVGDDSQSIYSFRGGLPHLFVNFEEMYADSKTILLDTNFRSTPEIVAAGDRLIEHNKMRYPKSVTAFNPSGSPIVSWTVEDAEWEAAKIMAEIESLHSEGIPYKDMAVLYRTNAQSRAIEDAFIHGSIPHVIVSGQGFYGRKEVKDVLAYLRLIHNHNDDEALERIINVPSRYLGKVFMENLTQQALLHGRSLYEELKNCTWAKPYQRRNALSFVDTIEALSSVRMSPSNLIKAIRQDVEYDRYLLREEGSDDEGSDRLENLNELAESATRYSSLADMLQFIAMAQQAQQDRNADQVQCMTIHRSKGLEYPVVFVAGVSESLLPHKTAIQEEAEGNMAGIEEERRLGYVAITRAKHRLYLSSPLTWREKPVVPSRFIQEAGISTQLELETNLLEQPAQTEVPTLSEQVKPSAEVHTDIQSPVAHAI